jgi:coiled-coil domain-containing protein 39
MSITPVQERQGLVTQWEAAMQRMRHCDEDITAATAKFAEMKGELRQKAAALDLAARDLDNETAASQQHEAQIEAVERDIERLRAAYTEENVRFKAVSAQAVRCAAYRPQVAH